MEIGKVYVQGNSLGIIIPVAYRRALGWTRGTQVFFKLTPEHELVVKGLQDELTVRKRVAARGSADVTNVNRHVRLPRD